MKSLGLSVFTVALFVATLSAAEPSTPAPEMVALEQFLALNDSQLAQMHQAIARVRAMSPEQRAQLQAQIARFRDLPAAQRDTLRRSWGQETPEIRDGWREMMQSLSESERAEIRRRLEGVPLEQRMKLRREMVERHLRGQPSKP